MDINLLFLHHLNHIPLDSFVEYDSLIESQISIRQVSRNLDYDRGPANRKHSRYDNGEVDCEVDVSLKDGLFSGEMVYLVHFLSTPGTKI